MLYDDLTGMVEKNDLISKSKELFWLNFYSYQKDSKEEFNEYFSNFQKDEMIVEVSSVSYCIKNYPDDDYCLIIVSIPIFYKEHIYGYYDVHFNTNKDAENEVEDDFFVIY